MENYLTSATLIIRNPIHVVHGFFDQGLTLCCRAVIGTYKQEHCRTFTLLMEYNNTNNLQVQETVFRRPGARNFISPASIYGIEQIISVKLLSIHLTATLSATAHVEHILSIANQRLHLLGLLKHQGLSPRPFI